MEPAQVLSEKNVIAGGELLPFERSIGVMVKDRAEKFSGKALLKQKIHGMYQELSWKDIFSKIESVAIAYLKSGIKKGDSIAILSENRWEMLVNELAVMSIGALSVPIFAGYLSHHIEYIVRDSSARRLVVSNLTQLLKLNECATLSEVESVYIIDYDSAQIKLQSICGVKILPFSSLLIEPPEGEKDLFANTINTIAPDDSCLIMYTSGTTGDPKGVELLHGNLISQQRAIKQLWNISSEDRFLSYLPWHHSFGGLFERFMALYNGATIAIEDGGGKDIGVLVSNWREIKPTMFFSVPGVYQRFADEIKARADIKEDVFHPELRFVFTAAAALPSDVSELFTSQGIPVLEGWGLTETSPCATLTDPNKIRSPGVVGWPIPGVSVMLSHDGEILVKGPNVMRGYYKLPTHNRDAFTPDGWFRTGDLGEWTENGLKILGRRDGVFKLLNAEKVFSAQIEMALIGGSPFIDQAIVIGSGRHYVTALLYANRRVLEEWGEKHGSKIPPGDDLATSSEIRRIFSHEVQRINTEISARFQRVKKFAVLGIPPTLETGELTPTSKVIRHKVISNHLDLIEALYKQGCPPPLNTIVCLGDCY